MEEAWMEVRGYRGYDVSNGGRVRSWWRIKGQGRARGGMKYIGDSARLLRQTMSRRYWRVTLYDEAGKSKTLTVHRLVLQHFGPPQPPDKPLALHKDDDRNNNCIDNLYWGTTQKNAEDRVANGGQYDNQGEKHPLHKLTEEQVKAILTRIEAGERHTAIAKDYGVTRTAVKQIAHGIGWKHLTGGKSVAKKETPEERSRRLATAKTYKSNTSGYRGVSLHKQTGKWKGTFSFMGKMIHLGLFSDVRDAAKAVNEAYIKYRPGVPVPNRGI